MGMLDNFIWRAYANEMMEHDEKVNKLIEDINSVFWDKDYEKLASEMIRDFDEKLNQEDVDKIHKETGINIYLD